MYYAWIMCVVFFQVHSGILAKTSKRQIEDDSDATLSDYPGNLMEGRGLPVGRRPQPRMYPYPPAMYRVPARVPYGYQNKRYNRNMFPRYSLYGQQMPMVPMRRPKVSRTVLHMNVVPLPLQGQDDPRAFKERKVRTCSLTKDVGRCEGNQTRWHFQKSTKTCHEFTFRGCGGNDNNFITKTRCIQYCSPELMGMLCRMPPSSRNCTKAVIRWFYNSNTKSCQHFTYGGCGGNENNFETDSECQHMCSEDSSQYCMLQKDSGHCRSNQIRWYYNYRTKLCERFNYGGCAGNSNNFHTKEFCMDKCSGM